MTTTEHTICCDNNCAHCMALLPDYEICYRDDEGDEYTASGSLSQIAAQLEAADYAGPRIRVYDSHGFVAGWVDAGGHWGAV